MREVVNLKCGRYSSPIGQLTIECDDKITRVAFPVNGKKAWFKFNSEGKFLSFDVEVVRGLVELPPPEELEVEVCLHQPQDGTRAVERDLLLAERDDLVQKRECVPHAAVGLARDKEETVLVVGDLFGVADAREAVGNVGR